MRKNRLCEACHLMVALLAVDGIESQPVNTRSVAKKMVLTHRGTRWAQNGLIVTVPLFLRCTDLTPSVKADEGLQIQAEVPLDFDRESVSRERSKGQYSALKLSVIG